MATDVKAALKEKATGVQEKPKSPAQRVRDYLERMKPELNAALPKHMNPDRMARVALTTIRTNPKLLECSIESLMGAVVQASQLGLEPGLLGHCYLIPFRNGKTGKTDVQFIIGYKGLLDLVRRSGEIESIAAHVVHEKDTFEFEYGLDEKLRHVPCLVADRGQVTLAYAYAKFKDNGGYQIMVMTKPEIEAIRERSKAKDNGPWVTDWEEMAKKTVLRRLCKYLPMSIEIAGAIERDEQTVSDLPIIEDEGTIIIDVSEVEQGA
jgi:recombination protein RecT